MARRKPPNPEAEHDALTRLFGQDSCSVAWEGRPRKVLVLAQLDRACAELPLILPKAHHAIHTAKTDVYAVASALLVECSLPVRPGGFTISLIPKGERPLHPPRPGRTGAGATSAAGACAHR